MSERSQQETEELWGAVFERKALGPDNDDVSVEFCWISVGVPKLLNAGSKIPSN